MRRRTSSLQPLAIAALGLALVAAVPARPADLPDGGLGIWSGSVVEANEVERYASLDEMTESADAVVRGQVVAVTPGRVFGSPSDALHYAEATVRVDEVLAGELAARHSRELTLEIPLFEGPDSLKTMQSAAPWSESIFFLRNKGESARAAGLPPPEQRAESRFYRLVVFRAVIVNDAGRAVVMPGESDFLDTLTGRPFDEVVATVRARLR